MGGENKPEDMIPEAGDASDHDSVPFMRRDPAGECSKLVSVGAAVASVSRAATCEFTSPTCEFTSPTCEFTSP
eukprot:3490509-Pyramimonas_sp.AAC.1